MMKRIFLIAIVMGAAMAAHAQDFYHRPSFLAGRTLLTLSLFEEVQTEIKMTPDEITKSNDLLAKMTGEVQDAFQNGGGDFTAMRPIIEKINVKYDDQLTAGLTADQNTRLKQLFIQYNGGGAIANQTVEKDLALTDDQKAKVKAAQEDNFTKMTAQFSGGAPDPDAMKKLQDDLGTALAKILTDDQKTKFQAMQGTKFEFKKV